MGEKIMAKSGSKVSVCIPSFNYGNYVAGAIESVLGQTLHNFELIIVDDASTDNTSEIVGRYAKEDNRIKFIENKENLGMVKNWNKCVSLAQGRYITILHADDAYLPEILEIESKILDSSSKVGMVFSANYVIDDNDNILTVNAPFRGNKVFKGNDFLKKIIESGGNPVRFPTIMVRDECFQRIGLFDELLTLTADMEMWMRIGSHWGVAYVNQPLSLYRFHSQNESLKFLRSGAEIHEIHRALKHLFNNTDIDESERELLNRLMKEVLSRKALSLTYFCNLLDQGGSSTVERTLTDIAKIDEEIENNWKFSIFSSLLVFSSKYGIAMESLLKMFRLLRKVKWRIKRLSWRYKG